MLGTRRPFRLGDVFHWEDWWAEAGLALPLGGRDVAQAAVTPLIESAPFIIPPTLTKSELQQEPILSLVWRRASDALRAAERITFVGYSLPPTDLAARCLLAEAIVDKSRVRVVSLRPHDDYAQHHELRLRESYESLFGKMADEQFEWAGAVEWARRVTEGDSTV